MNKSQFHIINASAGSGKTYALVVSYLKHLLSRPEGTPYKHLLALTFTNKAVNEMKKRILEKLAVLASDTTSDPVLLAHLTIPLSLTEKQIQQRADRMLRKILEEYGNFDIITLDKFTYRIIRSFATNIKLPYGFEVEIDSDQMLSEMVEIIIDRVGRDEHLTKTLCEFSFYKISEQRSWDVKKDLLDFAKLILNENNREPLEFLKQKASKRLSREKKLLEKQLNTLKKEIVCKAKEVSELINSNDLSEKDFYKGVLYCHFENISRLKLTRIYASQLESALKGEKPLYAKHVGSNEKMKIEAMKPDLLNRFLEIKDKVCQIYLIENVIKHWTPLSLLRAMEQTLEDLQKSRQRILLAKFNSIIKEVILQQPAPFIYERLGERYRHFFIDEFQDTSQTQWQNLIPLIGNALESETLEGERGSLLLVGDPKQAVYRWRGGDSRQILDLIKGKKTFQISSTVARLDVNYRSSDWIVNFNNAFFKKAGTFLASTSHQKLFVEQSGQKTNNRKGGFVTVDFVPKTRTKKESDSLYVIKTIAVIEAVKSRGYKDSEIAILVRKNKQSVVIGHGLAEKGYRILSSESLAVEHSSTVQFLISLIRLSALRNVPQEHKIILDFFWEKGQHIDSEYHEFVSRHLNFTTTVLFNQLRRELNFEFDFERFLVFPIYNAIEYALSCFNFINKKDAYLMFLLENIFEFSNTKGTSKSEYIRYWERNSSNFHLTMPEDMEAVQIMTIHKAKGLEFPVVVLPFMDETLQPRINNRKMWFPLRKKPLSVIRWGLINYSQDIKNYGSMGASLYEADFNANELDAFNTLYVSMTRAVEELHIVSQVVKPSEPKSHAFIFQEFTKEHGHEIEHGAFEWGKAKPKADWQRDKNHAERTELSLFTGTVWQEKLITQFGDKQNLAQQRGVLFHYLLGKIKHVDELEYVLVNAVEEGVLNENECFVVEKSIKEIIYHPDLHPYFTTQDRVLCERDILLPNGTFMRPDRVVQSKDKTVIIDYKTGVPKPHDQAQLETYASAFSSIGVKDIKKILVYIGKEVYAKAF